MKTSDLAATILPGRTCPRPVAAAFLGAGLAFLLLPFPGVWAQAIDPSDVPPSVEQPRDRVAPPEPLAQPGGGPVTIAPLPEGGAVPPEAAGIFLTLGGVRLAEAPAGLDEAELAGLYSGLVGQRVNVEQLYGLARAMTRLVRTQGYLLSQVVLPPQEIGEDGQVVFQFVAGHVSATAFEGEPWAEEVLGPYAKKIAAERPLTAGTLERYLLLMNEVAGVRVRSDLSPDPKAGGGARLTSRVEARTVEGALTASNEGPRYLGRQRAGMRLTLDRVFGLAEETTFSAMLSEEDSELETYHLLSRVPLGAEGMRLLASVSKSSTRPGGDLGAFDLEGDVTRYSLDLAQPVIRSRLENLRLQAGLAVYDGRLDAMDGITLWHDRIASASAGAIYDTARVLGGVTLLHLGVEQGIDAFHAGVQSRRDGREEFTAFTAGGAFNRGLGASGLSAYPSAGGSYARNPLPSAVEFASGQSARGYDTGEITGYRGAAGTFELRLDGTPGPKARLAWQAFAFYDTTTVWRTGTGSRDRESLSSAGTGLRFDAFGRVKADIYGALPLSPEVASYGDKDPRLFFNLAFRF